MDIAIIEQFLSKFMVSMKTKSKPNKSKKQKQNFNPVLNWLFPVNATI